MITLRVNGKAQTLAPNTSALELLHALGYTDQRIALEINQTILPRSRHATFILTSGDQIEIITAVGGG